MDAVSPPPHLFSQNPMCNSQLLLFSSENWLSPPSGWSRADWGCSGLFGWMWTQCPVSYRRGWPETYWILAAEPGALGQSGRLGLSHARLELDMNWANSWRRWRAGEAGVLQSMGSQGVWTELSGWTTARLEWYISKTKGASPCSQKTTLKPQVVGVGMELGRQEASVESLSVLDSSVVALGGCVWNAF